MICNVIELELTDEGAIKSGWEANWLTHSSSSDMVFLHRNAFYNYCEDFRADESYFKDPSSMYILLRDHNEPVAMFIVTNLTEKFRHMHSFAVLKTRRRQGLGKLMYNYLCELTRDYFYNDVVIFDCDKKDKGLVSFYEAVGAKKIDDSSDHTVVFKV